MCLPLLKALVYWMQNNWQSAQKSKRKLPTFSVKWSEVIWDQRQDEVWSEIEKLLSVTFADAHTPGWFMKHMMALENVYRQMSRQEKEQVDADIARIAEEGFSKEKK